MTTTLLGEVVEINPRDPSPPKDAYVSFVGMAQLDAGRAVAKPLETRRFGEVSSGYTVFRDGDILAAKITPCWENGKVGQAVLDNEIGVGSTEFHVLRPSAHVDGRYLLHFLRQPAIRLTGEIRMTGSAGQRRVPVRFLETLRFPLVSIDTQRRIADILDKADALRAKRQKVLDNLDALTQSIFEEALKQGAYTFKRLGDLAEFRGGASLPSGVPYLGQQGGQLLMRVSDMNMHGNERFVLRTSEWGSEAGTKSALVRAHAVVLPKRGASIATNKKRLTVRPTLLDPNLMGVEPDVSQIRSEFLFAWFESFDLSTIASGSSVPQLNKKDLAPLQVPVPESDVQDCFVQNVRMVQRLRRFASDALSNSDELTQGLRSRLFNR